MSEMTVEQAATIIRDRLREGAGCIHAEFIVGEAEAAELDADFQAAEDALTFLLAQIKPKTTS